MKLSVIVPVYNCDKYLTDCLDSILAQTYPIHEMILIDDGSKDESSRICDDYAVKDSRIRVIHQENNGVSHARNVGMSCVTGDAVSFIDSDDTLEPDMYELLVRVMEEYDADIAHCGYKHFVREEIRLVHDTKQIIPQSREEALDCFINGRLFGGGLWNKLFRNNLITELTFQENLKINEDVLFCFEAFSKAKQTVYADYALYNYIARIGESVVFRTDDEKKVQDSCTVACIIWESSRGTSLNDAAIQRYIRALSGYYKFCVQHKKAQKKEIAAQMFAVADKASHLGRNMTITVKLIRYCPWLYTVVNYVYTKLRKPQWEARKD